MTKSPKANVDEKQIRTFRKAARELEADESEDRFKDVLRKIAKGKPAIDKSRSDK